jgi:cytochrome P450
MPGRWGVFHYEACAELGRDPRLSCARRVPNFFPAGADERLELDDLFRHLGRWILMKDAPEHGRLRKSMNCGFSPAVIEKLKPRVVGVVEELLLQLELAAEPDLVRDLAYPLPVRVISRLLGVPDSLHPECVALSNDFAAWFGNPLRTVDAARAAQAAVRRLVALFETIVRERTGKNEGDLLDLMLEIAQQAELTPEELYAQCVLLLIAGHETTRNLIGNGIYTLLRHPEALAQVRASESAVRAAVEEVLRYESPVQAYGRGTTEDIDYGGVTIPEGSAVFFIVAAAHRDPRHVSEPDRFDIHRKHNRHLAFGTDAHVCLGSTLARLEGQIAIGETLRRFPALTLLDTEPDWSPIYALRGLRRLRVRL